MKAIFLAYVLLLCAGFAPSGPAGASPIDWPDSGRNRLIALALTQQIDIEILSGRSATRSLEQWCARHHLADPAVISAKRIATDEKPATQEQRQQLQVTGDAPIRYRRVQLLCGAHVLSEADNWYVPARLTPEMNRLLETTDTPFGKVIQPLHPYRLTLSVERFWPPSLESWALPKQQTKDNRRSRIMQIPQILFSHQVLLFDDGNRPISLVNEFYQGDLLSFPPPH